MRMRVSMKGDVDVHVHVHVHVVQGINNGLDGYRTDTIHWVLHFILILKWAWPDNQLFKKIIKIKIYVVLSNFHIRH